MDTKDLIEMADFQDRNWLNHIEKQEKRHKAELKELNRLWKERLCSIENIYRKHLGLTPVRPEDLLDELPLIKDEVETYG